MTDLRTAALRALEALEMAEFDPHSSDAVHKAITALKAALAIIQPEIKDDKPFGYFRAEPFGWTDCAPTDEGAIPLYAKVDSQGIAKQIPPEAQTEAEKIAYCAGWWAAMEAKREQQEPMACIRTWHKGSNQHAELLDWTDALEALPDGEHLLYTHPPRQWRGLTEEEMFHVENNVPDSVISDRQWTVYFARAIEQALRSKNHE
jgi:hypothetical protein